MLMCLFVRDALRKHEELAGDQDVPDQQTYDRNEGLPNARGGTRDQGGLSCIGKHTFFLRPFHDTV